MSELLTIDGMVLPGREGAGAEVRPEVSAPPRPAPRWLLPLAAAALLHLGVLVLLGVMVRSTPMPEGGAEVLPIRLYAAGEVSELADSANSVKPRQAPRQSVSVKTQSGKGKPNATAMAVAEVAGAVPVHEVMALVQSAPLSPSVAAREVSFSAPVIPELADGVGGQLLASASVVGSPGSQLGRAADNPAGGGFVASGDQSLMASGADSGVVLAYPLYRENPPPEYPLLARRRQLEGTVVLEAQVGADGLVEELALHQSSGHRLLDEAALKGVKGWRFEPGRRGVTAVAMKVLVPVRFGLR